MSKNSIETTAPPVFGQDLDGIFRCTECGFATVPCEHMEDAVPKPDTQSQTTVTPQTNCVGCDAPSLDALCLTCVAKYEKSNSKTAEAHSEAWKAGEVRTMTHKSDTTKSPPLMPSADPCDYATYGAWFDALRVRGDIQGAEEQRIERFGTADVTSEEWETVMGTDQTTTIATPQSVVEWCAKEIEWMMRGAEAHECAVLQRAHSRLRAQLDKIILRAAGAKS